MSEVTFETGQLPRCPYCELKHVTDAKAQSADAGREKGLANLQKQIASQLGINPVEEYDKVRRMEHKVEDYITRLGEVKAELRQRRHEIEEMPYHEKKRLGLLSDNPDPDIFRRELGKETYVDIYHEKEECAASSFRVIKPNPEHLLTICCPLGEYSKEKERCQVGTMAQKLEHLHKIEIPIAPTPH